MYYLTANKTRLVAETLADLSAQFCLLRDSKGWTVRDVAKMPALRIWGGWPNRPMGRMSYNGRVWPDAEWQPGMSPIYCPFA